MLKIWALISGFPSVWLIDVAGEEKKIKNTMVEGDFLHNATAQKWDLIASGFLDEIGGKLR